MEQHFTTATAGSTGFSWKRWLKPAQRLSRGNPFSKALAKMNWSGWQRAGRQVGSEDHCPAVPSSQRPMCLFFQSIIWNNQQQRDDCQETRVPVQLGWLALIPGIVELLLPAAVPSATQPKSASGTSSYPETRGLEHPVTNVQCGIFWKYFFQTNVCSSHSATGYKLAHDPNTHGSDVRQHV